MILRNRNDLFKIELPKIFIPVDIKERWHPYVFRMPTPIKDISELVNYSIQSITIPNFNYTPVEQTRPGNQPQAKGTERKWRNSASHEMLIDRTFTITFQLLDGNINYRIMLETFFHYYDFKNPKPFTFDIPVHILDAEGNRMYSTIYHDCLFTGLNQFTLSYSEITPDFRTFECTFAFNEMKIDYQLQ